MTAESKQRRQFSRRGALGVMAASAAVTHASLAASGSGERPNILWLVSEDNNPFIGAYGDRLARTPTIDGLARRGVLFRNTFSNAPVCAPSRFSILTGVYSESCAPANQMRAVAKLPPDLRTYPELMREAGYFCTNNTKTDYNCDVDPAKIWDIQGASGHWRGRPAGKPFMAVFNYETTHESRLFKPTVGRVTPDMVRVPPYLPDTPGIRQDYASYYNLMEAMDSQLAERLAELKADGLADDTIVFYYSDNGGVLPRSKRYCTDEGLRCALVIYAPPKWEHLLPALAGGEVTSPVSLIDLPPTVLSLAGMKIPAQMRGVPLLGRAHKRQKYAFGMRNRMDERIDFQRTVTDGRWRYIRNYMPHRPLGQHQAFEWLAKGYQDWEAAHRAGTLNATQERFFQPKPFEELYDLETDPHQLINLATGHGKDALLAKFARALDGHMVAIHDNGFLPETMAGEGLVESRNPRVYPLHEVMQLAAQAASKKGQASAFTARLNDPAPVVRYWAATGLLILGSESKPAAAALQGTMRSDPSPFVRIVAAEALAKLDHADMEPIGVLADLIDHAPAWQVKLHALNALTYTDPAAAAVLPALRRAAQSEQEFVRNSARYLVAVLEGSYQPSTPIFDLERMMRRSAGKPTPPA